MMVRAFVSRGGKVYRKKKFRKGASIHDMVMSFNPETKEWEFPTVCILNNAPVLRKDWGRVRPGQDDALVFLMLPLGGGGGSNPLQVLAMVAVAVVAVWAGPVIAGALFGGSALAGSLLTAGIMMIGGMLIGALFPVSTPKTSSADEPSPTYSVNPANNMARLYQPEPEGFGRMKIVSDLASRAWPIYSGNNQYLHQVFVVGRGYYDIESMAFGDTTIWTKAEGVLSSYELEIEFREPGQAVTLFPDNVEVSMEVSGQNLHGVGSEGYTGFVGPYAACPPGTSVNRIVNNIVFPGGVGRYNSSGKYRALGIGVLIEYRAVDDYDRPLSGWSTLIHYSFSARTTTAIRESLDVAVTEGRYQVRARRTDDQSGYGDRAWHICQWENLQGFLPGNLRYGVSVIALRTKATDALSGVASNQFSVTCTRKLPLWDATTRTWSEPRSTRSFAAAVSQVARADYSGNLSDDRLDLDTLWKIDMELAAKGWTFDGYFDDFYNVWSLIMGMSSPFGVIPRVSGGRLTFAHDKAGRPVRHIFTPANIVRGSFSITYNTFTESTPDDVEIEYLDEGAGFQHRTVQAALPDSESRSPASRNFVGVVKRRQAFFMGVRLAAANRHRRLEFKWQTEAVGRLISPGDIAVISHPYLAAWQSGTVKDSVESTLKINLGTEIKAPPDGAWLALNGPDGRPWGPCKIAEVKDDCVWLDAADYALVLTQYEESGRLDFNPFAWLSTGNRGFPTIWTIEAGPEYENRVIISAISTVDRFHYEITGINDAPEAYAYQDLKVPIWTARDFYPQGNDLSAPDGFRASARGDNESPIVVLTWLPVPGATSYLVQYSVDGAVWLLMADVYINEAQISVEPGTAWIRVAAQNQERQSAWGVWTGKTGDLFAPVTEFNLAEPYYGAKLHIGWEPSEYNPINYTVSILPQSDEVVRSTPVGLAESYSYTPDMALADGGPWRELILRLETAYLGGTFKTFESGVQDPAPEAPTSIAYQTDGGKIIFTGADFVEEDPDKTGYVVVMGSASDFAEDEVLAYRFTSSFPFEWGGLEPGTIYYFRVAAKDVFFDFAPNYGDLNFSDVLTIPL